jgi:hypothetical protein
MLRCGRKPDEMVLTGFSKDTSGYSSPMRGSIKSGAISLLDDEAEVESA